MPGQTVLEELTQDDDLTQQHVERRVDDWLARIEQLYRNIESWLPEDRMARRGPSSPMREPLMKKLSAFERSQLNSILQT